MASTYITDYLARGLFAARPATPPVGTALALYDATDTGIVYYWTGSAWVTLLGVSLSLSNAWTASQRIVPVALTDAATITSNLALSNNFSVTLGGNRTLANPSNVLAGQAGQIVVTQDGSGSRLLTYASDWKFPGGVAPILSTAPGAIDILSYYVISTSSIAVTSSTGFA
jgi:hypothetical protein